MKTTIDDIYWKIGQYLKDVNFLDRFDSGESISREEMLLYESYIGLHTFDTKMRQLLPHVEDLESVMQKLKITLKNAEQVHI